jgi:antitoxin component of MazEF toxin-antitoxin module
MSRQDSARRGAEAEWGLTVEDVGGRPPRVGLALRDGRSTGDGRPGDASAWALGSHGTMRKPGSLAERISACILIGMKVVKVRRVGNSNVVSIPRELEARGYTPGTPVLVEELDGGELRIMPTEQVRDRIRSVGQRVVAEHAEALKILAEHDPDSERTQR